MWASVAADAQGPAAVSDQLVIVVGGVITAAIVALGGVLVAIVNSRAARTTPSPPAPTSPDEHVLYERTAVLTRRADDADERFDMMDRRLDQVERRLDLDDPKWRH